MNIPSSHNFNLTHKIIVIILFVFTFSARTFADFTFNLNTNNEVEMNNLYSCTALFEVLSNTINNTSEKATYKKQYKWFIKVERAVEDTIRESRTPTIFHVYRKMGVDAALFYIETIKTQNKSDLEMVDFQIDVCIGLAEKTGYKF